MLVIFNLGLILPLKLHSWLRMLYMGYSFWLAARFLLHASSHRQDNTYHGLCYTSRGTLAKTRNSSLGPLLSGVCVCVYDTPTYFSFQPVLHDWCNKGRGMCYPICGMVHIKEPLLLINKSSLCGRSGFPFSLSEWSLTICLTPYNHR